MKKLFYTLVFPLVTCTASANQTLTYTCDGQTEQTLQINGSQLTVSSSDPLNGMNFVAVFDPSYKPRTPNKIRFIGKEKNNSRAVLLFSGMLSGARMGYVSIRGSEDGYWSEDFKCYLKR